MESPLVLYNKINNFGRLLDMKFEVTEPGRIIYSMPVTEDILATTSAAHGGALAAFMDAIIGVASLSAVAEEGKLVSTVEFKINYLNPALLNDQLRGFGKVIKKGKRIIITQGKIFNQKDELLAICTGTLNAYPIEKSDILSSQ
jgi:uncharacterized protein (TIGR00369 family)